MRFTYGGCAPLRLLEDIWLSKELEKEQLRLAAAAAPPLALDARYEAACGRWEAMFSRTGQAARHWIDWLACGGRSADPYFQEQLDVLRQSSQQQTLEFRGWLANMADSSLLPGNPAAARLLALMAKPSEKFPSEKSGLPADAAASRAEMAIPPTATGEGSWSDIQPPSPEMASVGEHKLPKLPYSYHALEPFIDAATVKLHHTKHHQNCVDGLNRAERMLEQARQSGDYTLVAHWQRELAFHGAGHDLHALYWNGMTPKGGGPAVGPVAAAIAAAFGGFAPFQQQFSAVAEQAGGSGWTLLVWSRRSRSVGIALIEQQQPSAHWEAIPLLALDMWEHAYYLKYGHDKKHYIDAWWKLIHWDFVNERYRAAHLVKWPPC